MFLVLLPLACSSPEGGTTVAELVLTDANTYSVDVDLEFPERTAAGRTDLLVTWEELATDVWGEPLGDRQVGRILLVGFTRGTADMTEALETWTTKGTDVTVYASLDLEPGATSAQLSDLAFLGIAWSPEESFHNDGFAETWFLVLEEAHDSPSDTLLPLAWVALQPDDTTAAEPLSFPESSGSAALAVDLQPGGPLTVSPGSTSWTVDCSAVNEPSAGYLDSGGELFVAHSELTVEELNADLHGASAHRLFLPAVEGLGCLDGPVDLAGLVERDTGEGFAGFSAEGTWFVGMRPHYPFVEEGLPLLGAVVVLAE